jgi:hypothetical protein
MASAILETFSKEQSEMESKFPKKEEILILQVEEKKEMSE